MPSDPPATVKFALIACFAAVLTIFAALSQRIAAALGIFVGTYLIILACAYAILLAAFVFIWKKTRRPTNRG